MNRTPKDPNQCPQCWQRREPESFLGARGGRVRWCAICRGRYGSGYARLTPEQKLALPRRGVSADGPLRARLVAESHGHKLGGIPASMTTRTSCPPSCALYGAGCYAEFHLVAAHWRTVGARGDSWEAFCAEVARLPAGTLWRHNVAGDLPGEGEALDRAALGALVAANRGRRGFTFTHKHRTAGARAAIAAANRDGFVVNLSADSIAAADRLADRQVGPVVVLLSSDAPDRASKTPGGRTIVVCPAQRGLLTCRECALCAMATRKAIVGFRAHGQAKAQVDHLLTLRRKRSTATA